MYHFIRWDKIDHKCNTPTDSNAWFPQMTPFLFWWTNKHTCTPEETVCHCPVACCVTAQFALPNPTGTGKDGINHYCPLPYKKNQETGPPEMKTPIGQRFEIGVMFAVLSNFMEEFASHSQHRHTDTVLTIPMSRPNICATNVGSSQHVRLVKPYFSMKYDFSCSGPFRSEHWWPVTVCRILTFK